jgi:hypothetical protein
MVVHITQRCAGRQAGRKEQARRLAGLQALPLNASSAPGAELGQKHTHAFHVKHIRTMSRIPFTQRSGGRQEGWLEKEGGDQASIARPSHFLSGCSFTASCSKRDALSAPDRQGLLMTRMDVGGTLRYAFFRALSSQFFGTPRIL